MHTIKVLAIDGGGIRGIIPAFILGEIHTRLKRDLCEVFDLIAGTSTGGIIALGIGTRSNSGQPYSPQELLDLYVRNGPAIFRKSFLTPVRQLFLPKYPAAPLEAVLEHYFQATELSAALTPLLISSYDLQGQVPFFFKSHRIAQDSSYNFRLTSVARATSAAQTYFAPAHLKSGSYEFALVDGGVFVNNPAMAAYAEARTLYPDAEEMTVLSVGTGDRQDQIRYTQAEKWGLLGWARQIVPVFMDSVSEAVDYELKTMPGCAYYRLQVSPLAGASGEMDDADPENVRRLQNVAARYVAEISGDLTRICAALEGGRGSDLPGTGRVAA